MREEGRTERRYPEPRWRVVAATVSPRPVRLLGRVREDASEAAEERLEAVGDDVGRHQEVVGPGQSGLATPAGALVEEHELPLVVALARLEVEDLRLFELVVEAEPAVELLLAPKGSDFHFDLAKLQLQLGLPSAGFALHFPTFLVAGEPSARRRQH